MDIFAYLDHNVLDLMIKGDPHGVKNILNNVNLIPVFSNETLIEIHRSKGYENNFLDLLNEIQARYIDPILDEKFRHTGDAKIYVISPKEVFERFLENLVENPEGDFGLSKFLMKSYGGNENISFEEIFRNGADDLQKYLSKALEDLDEIPGINLADIEECKELVSTLPEVLKSQTFSMTAEMDSQITSFEVGTGIGPKILNNIKSPNVVEKVWDLVSDKLGTDKTNIETFFGIKPHSFEDDSDRKRTLQEKVNAVYHQLNYLGYYRDSGMKKERRFKASFSDMTHAGNASFCHLFLCRDKDMVKKTEAAYEFLGVKTKILYFSS